MQGTSFALTLCCIITLHTVMMARNSLTLELPWFEVSRTLCEQDDRRPWPCAYLNRLVELVYSSILRFSIYRLRLLEYTSRHYPHPGPGEGLMTKNLCNDAGNSSQPSISKPVLRSSCKIERGRCGNCRKQHCASRWARSLAGASLEALPCQPHFSFFTLEVQSGCKGSRLKAE